jgi:dTDP-4-amino-4,6-dideoxygalactose transaminase
MFKKVIPFFPYHKVFTKYEEELINVIRDVGKRGAFILQSDLQEFEENIAKYIGVKYAVGVGNATDGLHLALRAAGIGPGDEVIFCSHTMVATASAIYFTGAIPVPVDCGPDHLIDPRAVEEAITPRTKVILPTQLNGRTANMDALQSIAEKYNLIIIEDAAQALGSKFKGKCAGTFGLAGVVSFYPAKTLGCLGDGGIIFTNDDEMYRKLKMLRDHGRDEKGEIVIWGFNSRLDNIQAAILNYKLKFYDKEIGRRREIARLYYQLLGDVKELLLPPPPDGDPDHFDIYQNYEIEAERREELREYLSKNGIGTIIQWGGKPVHQFEKLGFNVKLPYTEKMFQRCLLLPMNSFLTDEDVCYIANKIREFYGYEEKGNRDD